MCATSAPRRRTKSGPGPTNPAGPGPGGVRQINERGVVHDGVEYPLDVLIYATGFQWMATSTFNMIIGREGRTLKQKWETEGTRTFLGLHSHGFPNLFIVSGPQGGG